MPRPRTIWVSPLVALFSMGFVLAVAQDRGDDGQSARRKQPAAANQPAVANQPAPIDMQQLLNLWEGQSAKLKTLEVSIYRIDKNVAWGDEEHYQGHAA